MLCGCQEARGVLSIVGESVCVSKSLSEKCEFRTESVERRQSKFRRRGILFLCDAEDRQGTSRSGTLVVRFHSSQRRALL